MYWRMYIGTRKYFSYLPDCVVWHNAFDLHHMHLQLISNVQHTIIGYYRSYYRRLPKSQAYNQNDSL
jgi:hypothetical protein